MKKVIITLAALVAVTFGMAAQESGTMSKVADHSMNRGAFFFEPISYWSLGYHLKNSEMADAQNAFNDEFTLNLVEFGIRPYSSGLISIGINWDWDCYRLDKNHIWGADATTGTAWIRPLEMSPYKSKVRSNLVVNSFSAPISFQQNFGKGAIRIGAVGEYNLPAKAKTKVIDSEDKKVSDVVKGIKTQTFTYGFFGAISYYGFGVYAKYCPTYQFADGVGPHFKTLTVGLVIGL